MGWIINKIREWFCEHDWELLEKTPVYTKESLRYDRPTGTEWTYRCKKCGRKNIVKNF